MKHRSRRSKYIPAVIAALIFIAFLTGAIIFYLQIFSYFPPGSLPLPLAALMIGGPAVVIIGILLALLQRIKEIKGGEEDDASQY